MAKLSDLKNKLKESLSKIPEFSEKNYVLAGYIVAALITLAGAFLIYEVLTTDALTFKANWNMFKSPLGSLCMIIGFICAIVFWGKMGHWSRTPITEYRDSSGNLLRREENFDVMEQSFAKILMPILGHFILEPIIYGAIIYYPIQCIIAILGAIFPYIVTIIVLAIIAGAWLFTKKLQFRYRSALLIVLGVLFTAGFAMGGFAIKNSDPGSTISLLVDTTQGGDTEVLADNQTVTEPIDYGEEAPEAVTEDEEEVDEQFVGVGEEGLLGSLPDGTSTFEGNMDGFPIEFAITKPDNSGSLSGMYKNVKYGTTMKLDGESLPAMGGNITFYGNDNGTQWTFTLTGTVDNITGTAQNGDKEMKVTLNKK